MTNIKIVKKNTNLKVAFKYKGMRSDSLLWHGFVASWQLFNFVVALDVNAETHSGRSGKRGNPTQQG